MKFDDQHSKIEYLQNILKKKKMLQETTRSAAYSLLGDIYLKEGKRNFYRHEGNKHIEQAARNYIDAGELGKADSLIGTTFRYRPDDPEQSGFPALVGIAIGSKDYQGQKLLSLIEEKRRQKRGSNLTQKVSAFIFLIAGFIFMVFPDFTTTGNVISSSSNIDISFFLSFVLMIIGGVLLFKSLRN